MYNRPVSSNSAGVVLPPVPAVDTAPQRRRHSDDPDRRVASLLLASEDTAHLRSILSGELVLSSFFAHYMQFCLFHSFALYSQVNWTWVSSLQQYSTSQLSRNFIDY